MLCWSAHQVHTPPLQVTMEPGDEVANHLEPGELVKSPLGQGGPSLALLDGNSAAADMEDDKREDHRRRLLEGNQVGSWPALALCWLACMAALGRAGDCLKLDF